MRTRNSRPFLLLLGLALYLGSGGHLAAWATGQTGDLPSVVAPERLYDAGTVVRGTVIEKAFPVRNGGGSRLDISNLESSCNCAAGDYTPYIEPGAEGSVSIRIETENLTGPVEKFIEAVTNDPASPKVRFTVRATVEDVILVLPGRTASMGDLPREEKTVRKWALKSEDGSPLAITKVEQLEGCADFEIENAEDGMVAVLSVTIPPHFEVRNGSDVVNLRFAVHTTHPRLPLLYLVARGELKDRLRRAPSEVRFGTVGRKTLDLGDPEDPALWRDLTVIYIGSEPLHIDSVTAHPDFLKVSVNPEPDFGNTTLRLRIDLSAPSGAFKGWVKAETSQGKLLWPVSGLVR